MDEPELTAENAASQLGLTPKRQTPDPTDAEVQPADEPEDLQRDADSVVIDREALRAAEQRDAALWAGGFPPPQSAAQKRKAEREFI